MKTSSGTSFLLLSAFLLALTSAGCNADGGGAPAANERPAGAQSSVTHAPSPDSPSTSTQLPVASSHGGASKPPAGSSSPSERPEVATPEFDEKIKQAEAKARRAGATASDKRAAAAAYFERGMFYRGQQNPRLYKFALGDLRRALRLDPSHSEARAYLEEIEGIYRSMGRPVPTNGLEP